MAELNDQVAALQAKNEAARVATQRINEFRALYASKAAEYEELKVLLPEQREITNVLQGLQDNAKDSRLIVMRFSPRDDSQVDMIMAKPVEIEVEKKLGFSGKPDIEKYGIAATVAIAHEFPTTVGVFSVSRTGATATALTITYTVSGTATPGVDYVTLPGTVTLGGDRDPSLRECLLAYLVLAMLRPEKF